MTETIVAKNYGEPWKENRDGDEPDDAYMGIIDSNQYEVTCWEDCPSDFSLQRERRIIACVNALAGVPDELLEETCRLARLGAAVEADKWYRCHTCEKPQVEPPFSIHPVEEVDIDSRTVYHFDARYCSDACASNHKGYRQITITGETK